MQNDKYLKQAELLLRVLPYVAREEVFALKGGTAINFFWGDSPRLSVDIDLAYIPVEDRDISLLNIIGVDNIKDLPGVRYKLLNINRMNPEKHKQAYEKLRQYLLS
jgi:hypothetical protein